MAAFRRDDGSTDAMLPTHSPDPMSSGNPYAATSSHPRQYEKPHKSRKKWWILAAILAILIIVGAVLGGVLGSRASKNNNSSGSGKQGQDNAGSNGNGGGSAAPHNSNFATGTKGADGGNTGLPPLSYYQSPNFAVQTQTGANGQIYMAVATDTYALPAYATGVSGGCFQF